MNQENADYWWSCTEYRTACCAQASTQGLVEELQSRGEAAGARVLCPVPLVTGGLTEPQVVPRFLASLQVRTTPMYLPEDLGVTLCHMIQPIRAYPGIGSLGLPGGLMNLAPTE